MSPLWSRYGKVALAGLLGGWITFGSAVAQARTPTQPPPPEAQLESLEAELDGYVRQLSAPQATPLAEHCEQACQALEAMQRTVARICALDTGERCESARNKAEEARRKLSRECPACVAAQPPQHRAATKAKPTSPLVSTPGVDSSGGLSSLKKKQRVERRESVAYDISTNSSRGGCAACTVAVGPNDQQRNAALLMLLLGVSLAAARRRRH